MAEQLAMNYDFDPTIPGWVQFFDAHPESVHGHNLTFEQRKDLLINHGRVQRPIEMQPQEAAAEESRQTRFGFLKNQVAKLLDTVGINHINR